MAFFRSLSFTSSSSSSSSSSPPMPPTPTIPPSDILKESEEYGGLVRFSDSCTLIPSSPSSPSILAFLTPTKEKPHMHFANRHKSCLHNHSRKSSLPSPTFDDPPIVHVPTPVPSRPASPTTRARSSSFLSHFRTPSPPPFLLRSPTLPLRPCCPECAHSFTHPTPKERFTRGARRRQRSASLEPPQTLADKRCSFGAVGMDRHEETVPEDGILLPSITRGRPPARWSVPSTRPTHSIHRPVDPILLSDVAVPGSTIQCFQCIIIPWRISPIHRLPFSYDPFHDTA